MLGHMMEEAIHVTLWRCRKWAETWRKPMSFSVWVLNGPNMNRLGTREPEIYGSMTLDMIEEDCRRFADRLGAEMRFLQTNHEGGLVDQVHEACGTADAIVINPAGSTFHSVALHDALKIFEGPIVELHISNLHARDEMHRHSVISGVATGVICGLGVYGYIVAMQAAARLAGALPDSFPASEA